MRAYIKYISRESVFSKPAIFSTGGYSVKTEDGKIIKFDWCDMYADAYPQKDGRVIIEAELRNFDTDFYESSNEDIENLKDIPLNSLAGMELDEVYYECYKKDTDENSTILDVLEFSLFEHGKDEVKFSQENLERINSQQ